MKSCLLFHLLSLVSAISASQYCVEDDLSYIRDQENNAPSPAPSMNSLECTTQTSNARGRYSSTLSPCTFEFHKAEEHQRELDLIRFHTSDLCSSENAFLTVREYVKDFSDECVADFQRCYSLEHHRSVIWDFLCTKAWEIPEETTHVSVDCRRDKELVMEATTHRQEKMIRGENQAKLDTYETKLFNLAGILGVCLVGVFAISNLIVKPLVASRLNAAGCNQEGILPTRYHNLHTGSNTVSSSSDGAVIYEGEYLSSDIMVMGAEEDRETSASLSQHEIQMMEDFDSQIPDFDAVPITFPPAGAAAHQAHGDLTTDSAILPLTHPLSSEEASDPEESITATAASIISSSTNHQRSSSHGGPMELELVSLVHEPNNIPIVPATILYN